LSPQADESENKSSNLYLVLKHVDGNVAWKNLTLSPLFAALEKRESRFIIPEVTDHVQASALQANLFLGVTVHIEGRTMTI
jgi:hypothetical protein